MYNVSHKPNNYCQLQYDFFLHVYIVD